MRKALLSLLVLCVFFTRTATCAAGINVNKLQEFAENRSIALSRRNENMFAVLVRCGQEVLARYDEHKGMLANESPAHGLARELRFGVGLLASHFDSDDSWMAYAADTAGIDWCGMARSMVALYSVL